jgi:hypothetical protein
VLRVEKGGVAMVPPFSATETLIFAASSQTITASTPGLFQWLVVGQQVDVSGSALNDGNLTLSAVDGDVVTVAELLMDETILCTVATASGTEDFLSVDEGRFQLQAALDGEVRVTFEGDDVGGYVSTAAGILDRVSSDFQGVPVASGQVSSMDAKNSSIMGHYTDGETPGSEIMDFVGGSAGMFYRPHPVDGELLLGRLEDPLSAASSGSIRQFKIVDGTFDYKPTAEALGELILLAVRNWGPLDFSQLKGAVKDDPELLRQVTEEWQPAKKQSLRVKRLYQLLEEEPERIETAFTDLADAQEEASRRYALHGRRSQMVEFETSGISQVPAGVYQIDREGISVSRKWQLIGFGCGDFAGRKYWLLWWPGEGV